MRARFRSPSDSFLRATYGIRELHRLGMAGRNDSHEADEVRETLDGLWPQLDRDERWLIERLSGDLESLEYPRNEPNEFNAASMYLLAEVFVRSQTEGPIAGLKRLREAADQIPLATLSLARAACWLVLGDEGSATLFAEHAAKLLPSDDYAAALARQIREHRLPEWRYR